MWSAAGPCSRAVLPVHLWHQWIQRRSLGCSLLHLKLGCKPAHMHMQVLLARSIERFLGRRAAASLCVTQAMQQELAGSWGIEATAFHDKAPADFRPTLLSDQHALFLRLQVGPAAWQTG